MGSGVVTNRPGGKGVIVIDEQPAILPTISVGVIGAGDMGERHVRNLTGEVAGAGVVALMAPGQDHLQSLAQRYGVRHTFNNARDLIDHPEVDALLIAGPDHVHARLSLICIEAGKPVLCEKPLADNAAEAYEVIKAEIAGGKQLVQLGLMREYDPAHIDVKQLVESGELGLPLVFRGTHYNSTRDRLRTIEDVITNSVVHDIHSARWMMGSEIEEVFAATVPSAPDRPDTARFCLVQLRFRNSALGVIECNAEAGKGYEVDVKLTCEHGSVETSSLQSAIVSRNNNRGQRVEEDWLQRFDRAYVIEVREWIQSLANGTPAGPTAWDGYVSMVVADACIESAHSGQPVRVDIPETPEIYIRS